MSVAGQSPTVENVPVVDSFAVAAQIRMTGAGTRAKLSVALPEDAKATSNTLVSALLSMGRQVLVDYRLTDHELPEVEVTAVERIETVPANAASVGFTAGVTNDLDARSSTIALDSDFLLGNDGGVLLIAATLFAAAEHLLEVRDHPARPYRSGKPKAPTHNRKNPRRSRGRGRR